MRHMFKTTLMSSALLLSLAACSTVPNSSTLMTGIDASQLGKTTALRSAADPICVSFYKNAQTYLTAASKPNPGANFLTSLGVGVLASVATAGIVPAGLGNVGQIAASQAISTTVYQGSGLVLKGLDPKKGVGKNITEAATEVGCPVTLTI